MANQNFNQWLKFHKRQDESLREAIYRFSDLTEDPQAAAEYLSGEYTEEVIQDENQQRLAEGPPPVELAEERSPMPGHWNSGKRLYMD